MTLLQTLNTPQVSLNHFIEALRHDIPPTQQSLNTNSNKVSMKLEEALWLLNINVPLSIWRKEVWLDFRELNYRDRATHLTTRAIAVVKACLDLDAEDSVLRELHVDRVLSSLQTPSIQFHSAAKSYLNDPELSDLEIVLSDRAIHAHKIVLCRGSDYFKKLLTGNFMVSWRPGCGFSSKFGASRADNPTHIAINILTKR